MTFAKLERELGSAGNVAMVVHEQGSRLADVCQDLLDRFSCDSQFTYVYRTLTCNLWPLSLHLLCPIPARRKHRVTRARVLRVTHVCSRGTDIAERWRHAEEPDQDAGEGEAEEALVSRGLQLRPRGALVR